MKTTSLKQKDIVRKWYIIDCSGLVLGRLSSFVAKLLQGKHKVNYAPNLNNGDKIILINTSKIKFTGKKGKNKLYRRHSGYLGNLKEYSLDVMMSKNPNFVLRHSIYKMLPKNRMRNVYMRNLYLYVDQNHKHEAQSPIFLNIENLT